jgi:hypothetical protein
MTREQYIANRLTNVYSIIYHFYKENINKSNHKFILGYNEFFGIFNIWENRNSAIEHVLNYYDDKFEVTKIVDTKTNTIIKCL